GEAARALDTWAPLGAADDPHYLARFVVGLTHLIHDRFADAVAALQDGIAANQDNPPLSRDMQMVIDACAGQAATPGVAPAPQDSERSATSFLLGQTGGRGPVH
ncbi:MAG TPA: hypothetical protein VFQ57_02295, partial [Sphingomonas sp.]|nr:hypothetical protein [Sphingomonas sp.]